MTVQLVQGFWAHGNFLASLPADFGKLVNLHTISLAGNKLANLPKSLSGLVKLRDLGLQGNELSEVPAEMGALSESHSLMCITHAAMPYAKLTVPVSLQYTAPCCAVLCCAVLCCAVPCRAVLCCAMLCCAIMLEEKMRTGDVVVWCHSRGFSSPGLLGRTTTSKNDMGHNPWGISPAHAM